MKRKPLHSIVDYFLLVALVCISILLTLFFNGNRNSQKIIIGGMSVMYLLWGIYHHQKEHTLYKEVVLEYLLLGTLGGVLAMGLL